MKNGILNLSRQAGSLLIAAGFLAMAARPVAATVIYTTGLGAGNNPAFNASGSGKDVPVQENNGGGYLILADSFSLTADSIATDLLVPLSLAAATGTFSDGPVVDFSIVADVSGLPDSDSGGNPVSALYSGAATGITGTAGAVYDVSLTGSATLIAGTTYWLIAKSPGVSPALGCSPSCTYIDDEWYNNTSSSKASGYLSDYDASGWASVSNPTMAFTIIGNSATSAAPEPAAFILLGGGLLAIMLAMSRCGQAGQGAGSGPGGPPYFGKNE